MADALHAGLERYLTPDQLAAVRAARVAIAGCGGLGSNVALMLARSGVEQFLLIDHDVVEPSNLNRQQFWPEDVGRPKVQALAARLAALNPHVRLDARQMRLDGDNLPELTGLSAEPTQPSTFWAEALDDAATKALLVENVLAAGGRIVAASGIAGYGGPPMQQRRMGRLTIVGDFVSDVDNAPPLAPRVTQAAAMMANVVLGWILDGAGR